MSDKMGAGSNPAQASSTGEGSKRIGCRTIGVILVLLGLLALILVLLGVFNAPGQARIQVVVVTDTPNQPATQQPTWTASPVVRSNLDAEELAATNTAREWEKANATATAVVAAIPGAQAAVQAQAVSDLNPGQCEITSENLFIHWGGPYTAQSENGLPKSATDNQTIITAVEQTADGWIHLQVVAYKNHLGGRENMMADVNGWIAPGSPVRCNLTGVPFYQPVAQSTPFGEQAIPTQEFAATSTPFGE